jgi:large subunit ribosomal protein L29
MKTNELRNKTTEELKQELLALRKEQFNLRMQKKMGQLPKSHLIRKAKKDIARLKTVMNEKSLTEKV